MYRERTVRRILHLNQTKLKASKALVSTHFFIKNLTYITAHTAKTSMKSMSGTERIHASSSNRDRKMFIIAVAFCFFFNQHEFYRIP